MNTAQLVEELRQRDCFLNIDVATHRLNKPTVYIARFWYDGAHFTDPWDESPTFDEAVRLAAIRVIAQCDLDVKVPRPRVTGLGGFCMFIFWVSVGLIGAEIIKALLEIA